MIESRVLAGTGRGGWLCRGCTWTIHLGVRLLFATMPAGLADVARHVASLEPDVRVFAFSVAAGLSSAVLFGLAPALQATRISVARAFAGELVLHLHPTRLRGALVVAQVAASVLLLICGGILIRRYGPSGKYGDRCKCTRCARPPDSREVTCPDSRRAGNKSDRSAHCGDVTPSCPVRRKAARHVRHIVWQTGNPSGVLSIRVARTTPRYSTCLSRRDAPFRGQKPLPADRRRDWCWRPLHGACGLVAAQSDSCCDSTRPTNALKAASR